MVWSIGRVNVEIEEILHAEEVVIAQDVRAHLTHHEINAEEDLTEIVAKEEIVEVRQNQIAVKEEDPILTTHPDPQVTTEEEIVEKETEDPDQRSKTEDPDKMSKTEDAKTARTHVRIANPIQETTESEITRTLTKDRNGHKSEASSQKSSP